MFDNYHSLFANHSFKELIDEYSLIKDEIILKNNFNFKIEEKDVNIFFKIINHYGFEIFHNLNYISKAHNLNYLASNNDIKECNFKNFVLNQFVLLFTFLHYNHKKRKIMNYDNDKLEKGFSKIYSNIYTILLKYYSSSQNKNNSILDIDNIPELFRFNIINSLTDLLSKNIFFNISITYLIKFFTENNNNIKDLKSFYILFEQIYNNLLINQNNLNFLKIDKNIENSTIFKITNIASCTVCDTKLKKIIFDILILIYNKNYSNILSRFILNNIKESFCELKEDYDKNEIIKCIKYLYGQTEFINYLFNVEDNEKKDEYMPSTYFVFDGSKDSGINYNPNGELIKKNFILVFAFKINEIINDHLYPLITFVSENQKKEIIFNLSIYNNQLYLIYQGDTKLNLIDKISNNTSYLVVVEYYKLLLNNKIKISLNGNKKEITPININYKSKSSLKIGYIPNEVIIQNNIFNNNSIKNIYHFNGIIGPVIGFNNILDEKDFIPNIVKLKGRYDSILFLNNNNDIENYYYYEDYKFYNDKEFTEAEEYFMKLSKKIDEECLFTICPLSMLNSINGKTNFFIEDIYKKNNTDKINNKELFPNFNTLQIYSSKTTSTYAKKYSKSISLFVENDGISIYNLIIEYFYNLLRMLINEPKDELMDITNEINNVLCPIMNTITKIILYFKIDFFTNEIETFGFSLKKLFSLLIDIQPLNTKLVEILKISISKLLDKKDERKKSSQDIIRNFGLKLFTLICSSEYFDMSIYRNTENLFRFFELIINNNSKLINIEIMYGLLSFSFVLNTNTLDKHNNKPIGYTFKKNMEYKQMKNQYKNLIICFIKQCDNIKMYIKYIEKVCIKNISFLEKYILIKLYYKNNEVQKLYDKYIPQRRVSETNKSIFDIFKKEKDDKKIENNEDELLKEYNKNLSKIINVSSLIDPKNEKPYELLKSIFILLIYDHHLITTFNISKNRDNSNNNNELSNLNNTILENISFFDNRKLFNIKDNKYSMSSSLLNLSPLSLREEDNKDIENDNYNNILVLDFSSEEDSQRSMEKKKEKQTNPKNNSINKNNTIKEKPNYIFDILLNSMSYSFYIIKAIYSCLNEQWNKNKKIQFIKNIDELYEEFDMCFEFTRFKKKLLKQFIILIESLNDESVLEKSLKLIFAFMKLNISTYKSNNKNKIFFSRSIVYHLFESKSIINNFFDFCLNNEIITKNTFKNYIISSIQEINNEVLLYHPRPYIFSFIKRMIKSPNTQIIQIIKNICEHFIENLELDESTNLSINNYLLFNEIRFIKTMINIFEKNPLESQNLLTLNNYVLFISIQNLINKLLENEIIYDPHIYTFNPFCFKESNKNKEKKEIKILQSQETKVLSDNIIFLNSFELSLNAILLIWTQKKEEEVKNAEKYAIGYISKLFDNMVYGDHFYSYYFDLLNNIFQFNRKNIKEVDEMNKKINKEIDIKYKHYIEINPQVRDTRMISILLFLIIMKYQSLLINYEKMKNK